MVPSFVVELLLEENRVEYMSDKTAEVGCDTEIRSCTKMDLLNKQVRLVFIGEGAIKGVAELDDVKKLFGGVALGDGSDMEVSSSDDES